MADAVILLVPAEEPYRGLGPELARKYLEIVGGSASDADALAGSLTTALAQVTGRASGDAEVAIAFETESASVDVQVRCGRESTVVSQKVSVKK